GRERVWYRSSHPFHNGIHCSRAAVFTSFGMEKRTTLTMAHWGVYEVETADGRVVDIHPWAGDPDPSPLGRSMKAVDGPTRVRTPMVREGWLEGDGGRGRERRGADRFVQVPWAEALDRVA